MLEERITLDESATQDTVSQLLIEIAQERNHLEDFVGNLSPWYTIQENNIFGALFKHLDKQIAMANMDELSHNENIDPKVPTDEVRINLRKKFHSRVLRSLRFNAGGVFILIFLPVFFDFLDNAQFLTPLSIGIYPILAVATFVVVLTFVIVRAILSRAKKRLKKSYDNIIEASQVYNSTEVASPNRSIDEGKPGKNLGEKELEDSSKGNQKKRTFKRRVTPLWSWKRITGWILTSFGLSALVFFWPVTGIFAKILYKAPFFPSGWQIIIGALVIFISRFIYSILNYYVHYRELYFKPANRAWKKIYWASRGLLIIRSDKKRFEIMKSQLQYWHRVYGQLLRKPWSANVAESIHRANLGIASAFPPTVKVAQALDASADDSVAVTRLESIEQSLYHSLTSTGWRKIHFEQYFRNYRNMRDFSPAAKAIAKNLDSITPATSEALADEFETLVSNSNYLEFIAGKKLINELKNIQSQILKTGDLRVAILRPIRDQDGVRDWDLHLKSILVDETKVSDSGSNRDESLGILPSERFQAWSFSKAANISALESPAEKLFSYVLVPERIEQEIKGAAKPDEVEIERIEESEDKSIDIVLRIDIVGVKGDVKAIDVRLPKIEPLTASEATVCEECRSSVCQSFTGPDVACSNR